MKSIGPVPIRIWGVLKFTTESQDQATVVRRFVQNRHERITLGISIIHQYPRRCRLIYLTILIDRIGVGRRHRRIWIILLGNRDGHGDHGGIHSTRGSATVILHREVKRGRAERVERGLESQVTVRVQRGRRGEEAGVGQVAQARGGKRLPPLVGRAAGKNHPPLNPGWTIVLRQGDRGTVARPAQRHSQGHKVCHGRIAGRTPVRGIQSTDDRVTRGKVFEVQELSIHLVSRSQQVAAQGIHRRLAPGPGINGLDDPVLTPGQIRIRGKVVQQAVLGVESQGVPPHRGRDRGDQSRRRRRQIQLIQ